MFSAGNRPPHQQIRKWSLRRAGLYHAIFL